MLDYYRRPQLAGFNLKHMPFGTVRGNLRRSDADITSAQPYFPAAAALQTLTVVVDGVTYNVTLSGNSFAGTLTDINAAITTHGTAFDAGGTVAISTATAGGLGSVAVTGGSAAANIGFDLSYGSIRSVGGDLFSSPEGKLGNFNGTAVPGTGENLTIDAIGRITGRMMANMDLLHGDLLKNNPVIKNLGSVSSSGVVSGQPAYGYITLSSTVPIFNGVGGLLSAASTPEELSSFFEILDTTTSQPCLSKVVAVVQGTPTTAPPYANTAGYGANDGLNILGLDLVKASSAISAIKDGRKVTCSGAVFVTAVAGDLAEITSATNTSEWNNNGLKWVIQQVLDNNNAILRPLSKSEAAALSVTLTDEQPVVELTGKLNNSESYGTLRVHTGFFTTSATLVVSPPLPAGGSYQLWATQPINLRGDAPGQAQYGASISYRSMVSTQTPIPDLIISGLSASQVGSNVRVTQGVVRWHGRSYKVPGADLTSTMTGIAGDATYYIYFDSGTGIFKASSSGADVFGPSALGPYIFTASKAGGVLTLISGSRPLNFSSRRNVITVGDGGDFSDLVKAVDYANTQSIAYSETAASLGAYPHFEVVLLDSQVITSTVMVDRTPGLIISGANDQVRLSQSGTGYPMFQLLQTHGAFHIENLIIAPNDNTQPLIALDPTRVPDCDIFLRRVRTPQFSDVNCIINQPNAGSAAGNVVIEDCNLETVSRVISASAASVFIDNSILNCNYLSNSTTQVFSGSSGVNWDGGKISCFRSTFSAFGNPNDFTGGVVHDTGSTNVHVFEDCKFPSWTFETQHGTLWTTACETHIVRCSGGTTFAVANLTHVKSTIENCSFTGSPTDPLLTCPVIRKCSVTLVDTFSHSLSYTQFAGLVCAIAEDNVISGTCLIGIDLNSNAFAFAGGGGNKATGNVVMLTKGLQTRNIGIRYTQAFTVIANNLISLGAGYTATGGGITTAGGAVDVSISGNVLDIKDNTIGITAGTSSTIVGNVVKSASGTAVIGIEVATTQALVQNNWVSLASTDSASAAVSVFTSTECSFVGNVFSSTGGTSLCISSTSNTSLLWSSNILKGQVGTSGAPIQSRFIGNRVSGAAFIKGLSGTTAVAVSTNRFEGGVTLTVDAGVTLDFNDNLVLGNTTIPSGVQASNNFISGDLTFSNSNTSTWVGGIVTGNFNTGTNSFQLQVIGTTLSGNSKGHTFSGAIFIGIWIDPASTSTCTAGARVSGSVLGNVNGGGFRLSDCQVFGSISITVADATNPTVLELVDTAAGSGGLSALSMSGKSLVVDKCRFVGLASLGVTANVDFIASDRLEITDTIFSSSGSVSFQNKPTYAAGEMKSRTVIRGNRILGANLNVNSTAALTEVERNEVGSDTAASGSTVTGNLTIGYDPGGGVVAVTGMLSVIGNLLRFGGKLSITGNENPVTGSPPTSADVGDAQSAASTIAHIERNISVVEKDNTTHTYSGAPQLLISKVGRGTIRGNTFTYEGIGLASGPDLPILSMTTCNFMVVTENYLFRDCAAGTTDLLEIHSSSYNNFGNNDFIDVVGLNMHIDTTSYGNFIQSSAFSPSAGGSITDDPDAAKVGQYATWYTVAATHTPF